ncbi:hypothetical protein D3C75_224450 [compost metagenome]
MNSNIKPTFINFITNLEQSDLVAMITDLAENNTLPIHTQAMILRQSGIEVPVDADVEVITDHNIKKVMISYQSNYNGCSVYVKETIDGTDPDEYDEDKAEEIDDKVGGAIAEYACDNDMVSDSGKLRASDAEIERVAREIATSLLGAVEIDFEVDTFST